jgi:hypothetical protein
MYCGTWQTTDNTLASIFIVTSPYSQFAQLAATIVLDGLRLVVGRPHQQITHFLDTRSVIDIVLHGPGRQPGDGQSPDHRFGVRVGDLG